jgi:Ser/Thr protein kinase RdoA (MazF antagonist)
MQEREQLDNSGADMVERVGAAIGAFHATPVDSSARRFGASDILAPLQRAQQTLELAFDGAVNAELAAGVVAKSGRLVSELTRTSPNIDFDANATLHGDLHSNNILVGADSVSLIDMDRLARGPALAELGSLLAELIYRACVGGRALPLDALAAVLAGYQRAVPWALAADQLAWFTAAALVHERAYRCVTSLKAIRVQALPRIIEAAQALFAGKTRLPLNSAPTAQRGAIKVQA